MTLYREVPIESIDQRMYRYDFPAGGFMRFNATGHAHAIRRGKELIPDFDMENLSEWVGSWEKLTHPSNSA